MRNDEILVNLNKETKEYIDEAFSFLDYFVSNKSALYSNEDYMGISFLISAIRNSKEIRDIFAKYGVTLDRIYSCLQLQESDVSFISAEESSYVKQNQLVDMFTAISDRIKYNNNLEDTDILLFDLQLHQIFEYFLEYYYESISKLLDNMGISMEEILLPELEKELHELDHKKRSAEWLKAFPKESKVLDYDNCTIVIVNPNSNNSESYIVFKECIDFKKAIVDGKYKSTPIIPNELQNQIQFNHPYKIVKMAGRIFLTEDLLGKIVGKNSTLDFITTRLEEPDNSNEYFNISFNRVMTFGDGKQKKKKMSDINPNVQVRRNVSTNTPVLNSMGTDLTAYPYLKDPCVKRDVEIKKLRRVLLFPERDTSVIITGAEGCGKTALIDGLAYRIQKGQVPNGLKDIRIIRIDCSSIVQDTQYVGTLEKKINEMLAELYPNKNIVVFMDNIHQAVGAGKYTGNDNSVAELLKTHIANGEIRVIGATSTDNYIYYSNENPGFMGLFKEIKLPELDDETIYSILDNIVESYNNIAKPKLLLSPEERDMVIRWILDTSAHMVYDSKTSKNKIAANILKYAYAIAEDKGSDVVTYDDIKEALSEEEKISKFFRERAIKEFAHLTPRKPIDNIIDFNEAKQRLLQK